MIRFCPPLPPPPKKKNTGSEWEKESLISELLNKIFEMFPFLFIPMHLLTNLGMRDVITHSEEARTHSGREESVELVSFTASSSKTKAVLAMIWLTSQIGYQPSIIWPEVTSLKYKIRLTVWMCGTPLQMGRNLRARRYKKSNNTFIQIFIQEKTSIISFANVFFTRMPHNRTNSSFALSSLIKLFYHIKGSPQHRSLSPICSHSSERIQVSRESRLWLQNHLASEV